MLTAVRKKSRPHFHSTEKTMRKLFPSRISIYIAHFIKNIYTFGSCSTRWKASWRHWDKMLKFPINFPSSVSTAPPMRILQTMLFVINRRRGHKDLEAKCHFFASSRRFTTKNNCTDHIILTVSWIGFQSCRPTWRGKKYVSSAPISYEQKIVFRIFMGGIVDTLWMESWWETRQSMWLR